MVHRALAAVLAAAAAGWLLAPAAAAACGGPRHRQFDYVALGDSYAAGEGLAPYQRGTDTATDRCHRSKRDSYPVLLTHGASDFGQGVSVACSGATTAALFADVPDRAKERAQLDALSKKTKVVTLTIGGNDIHFAELVTDCIYSASPQVPAPGSQGCRARHQDQVFAATWALSGVAGFPGVPGIHAIPEIVAAIHARAPQARVVITGYPALLPLTVDALLGCQVNPSLPLFIAPDDAAWLKQVANNLTNAILAGTGQAHEQGYDVRYADVTTAFDGHNLCDAGDSWLEGLVVAASTGAVSTASFHPTIRGQQAYADAVTHAHTLPF